MYKDGEFTPEALRNLKIGYETLFVEVPIVIRNSPLTNIMMSELAEMVPEEEGCRFLDLGTASVLEGEEHQHILLSYFLLSCWGLQSPVGSVKMANLQ